MERRLEGKIAVVTGGGSGIGRVSVLAFVREGATVVVADKSTENGQETVKMALDAGGEAIFTKTDVTKAAEVKAVIERTVKTFGRLDIALNSAGVESVGPSTIECTEENWDRVININLKGVWLCMKYEIPPMLAIGHGSIVNMSSAAGLIGFPKIPDYVASKHGVVGLTRCAALEYAGTGIRVNAICPYAVQTPMNDRIIARGRSPKPAPIGRIGTAEEISEAAVWLSSDATSFITGHALSVDGGYVAG
ncbi:glucose 1-dehydrogenase [Chloroflexota bacterium]